jgi:hypothetical protein
LILYKNKTITIIINLITKSIFMENNKKENTEEFVYWEQVAVSEISKEDALQSLKTDKYKYYYVWKTESWGYMVKYDNWKTMWRSYIAKIVNKENNKTKKNIVMTYPHFLMSQLLINHINGYNNIWYDQLFEVSIDIYDNMFSNSEYNNSNIDLYSCIEDFIFNNDVTLIQNIKKFL